MAAITLRDVLDQWELATRDREAMARLDAAALARAALDLGHPTLACEILREPALRAGVEPPVLYLAALANAKIGGYRDASRLVDHLLGGNAGSAINVDALALAGRIAKDRWARLADPTARLQAGELATQAYRRAWDATHDMFPGINAATMLMLTGHVDAARTLARDVRAVALATPADAEPHWREATLGEAALLLGDADAAARHYASAVRHAGRQVGHVATMRRQLRLLARCLDVPAAVQAALAVPRIVVFAGHMIDAVDRTEARFPAHIEGAVAAQLRARLEALGAGFGYCSAASGADLLFIEAMLARDAEVHVVLPFDRDDFAATSVAPAGEDWVARFDAALARVASITHGVRERFFGDEALYSYASALIQGAAILRSRELETDPLLLAVVDEGAGGRTGGTREMLDQWRALALASDVVDLAPLRAAATATPSPRRAPAASARAVVARAAPLRRALRTMLFADVVGFSKLAEEDTPSFLVHFIGAIAEIVRHCEQPPAFVNTWGDGLFMVFDDVETGADFALQLRDAVTLIDWPAHGLPEGTSIRIGMHTGPVFQAMDPLIERQNYFGSHVIRAARIEPVAAPGAVYVSAEMAFCLAAAGARHYTCDYLGPLPLAKGFGSGVLYRLRRSDEAE
jgi:class 3 adenylate cyclase